MSTFDSTIISTHHATIGEPIEAAYSTAVENTNCSAKYSAVDETVFSAKFKSIDAAVNTTIYAAHYAAIYGANDATLVPTIHPTK